MTIGAPMADCFKSHVLAPDWSKVAQESILLGICSDNYMITWHWFSGREIEGKFLICDLFPPFAILSWSSPRWALLSSLGTTMLGTHFLLMLTCVFSTERPSGPWDGEMTGGGTLFQNTFDWWELHLKHSLQAHALNAWFLVGGAVVWSDRHFRRWSLSRRSCHRKIAFFCWLTLVQGLFCSFPSPTVSSSSSSCHHDVLSYDKLESAKPRTMDRTLWNCEPK